MREADSVTRTASQGGLFSSTGENALSPRAFYHGVGLPYEVVCTLATEIFKQTPARVKQYGLEVVRTRFGIRSGSYPGSAVD